MIEDPGGIRARLLGAILDRRRWPAIPAVILVTTLFVLALSGLRGLPAMATATASPGHLASVAAPTIVSTPGAAASPGESPSAVPTDTPPTTKPTKAPATGRPGQSFQTYAVRAGDTLGAIASRFGTTVTALVKLNHISDASKLRVGQILLIP